MKTLFSIFVLVLSTHLISAQDFAGHAHDVLEVKFTPDATQLISYSAGDGWLCLWEVKSARLLWRSKTEFIQKADEYYTLTSFAFSPDQNLIASSSGNGTLQL
jgi:WD40 repeat protein